MEADAQAGRGSRGCVLRRCGSEAGGRQVREQASGAIGGLSCPSSC